MSNRYWVGGTATWNNTAGTKWALTDGGAGGQAVPTSSDDVFFTATSGASTVTVSGVDVNANNLNFTGFTGTFTGNSGGNSDQLTITGSLTLSSGMTYTFVNPINFAGTGNLTSAGKTFTNLNLLFFNGGVYTLQDDFVCTNTNGIQLSDGGINANNKNVTTTKLDGNFGGPSTLTMGSGTWTLTAGNTTVWNVASTTSFNANTSTIKITDTSNTNVTFTGNGKTYNNIWFSRGASTGNITIQSSNTFKDFKDTGTAAHSIIFTAATTTTVTTFTVSGSAGNLISINSNTTATHALTKSGGGTISCDYLNIQHSVASPSSTWYAGVNSTNNQAVATAGSGWVFTAAPVNSVGVLLAF